MIFCLHQQATIAVRIATADWDPSRRTMCIIGYKSVELWFNDLSITNLFHRVIKNIT